MEENQKTNQHTDLEENVVTSFEPHGGNEIVEEKNELAANAPENPQATHSDEQSETIIKKDKNVVYDSTIQITKRRKDQEKVKETKQKSVGKVILIWVNNLVTTILIILLLSVAALVVSSKISGGEPQVFGYQIKTVLSGSMEPEIKTGSIIITKQGGDMIRFKKDDVITFMEEDERLVTHRVVEVIKSGEQVMYRTKGDNNKEADMNPVLSNNVVAEYTGVTIPYVGYAAEFASSKSGIVALVIIPGVILVLYSVFSIWKTIKQIERQYANSNQTIK